MKKTIFIITFLLSSLLFLPLFLLAHCPLCTAAAGIGAVIAKSIGMKTSVIGIFIGAFSIALGWWLANVLRNKGINFRFLTLVSILISFFTIVLPLKIYFYDLGSFYLNLFGDYGTLFNRTYIYDKFLLGAIVGGFLILIAPFLSRKLKLMFNRKIPFQGILVVLVLLIIFSFIFQLWF